MKKKSKLLTILLFTLMVAGSGYAKIANAACINISGIDGGTTTLCW